MKDFISKSNYLMGLECPSLLWTKFNKPEEIPEPDNKAEFNFRVGHIVGELAKKVFPEGIDIDDNNFKENLKRSEELIKERKTLFEPAFMVDNLYSRADILVPVGKDEWDVYEVKSGTRVKDVHLNDVAFQKYVYEKYGLKIRKCFLMHINNEYVKMGAIEPKELFVQTDITEEITGFAVEDRVEEMWKIIKLKERPPITCDDLVNVVYGNHLIDEFYDGLPDENVFELYRMFKKKAIELYNSGIKCIKDIPEGTKLTEKQKIQQVCAIEKRKHTDKEKLSEFIEGLRYPLYYLDFETINPAIPKFDGTKPYVQIPFQYSLHIVKEEGAEPEHVSFLADGTSDPRPKFMQSLKDNLGDSGSIIVYNQSFEIKRIEECVLAFPEFAEVSDEWIKRIVDLWSPFKNFYYYDPKQNGSASIKKVLPVMSDLSYKELDIGNGSDASIEYDRVTYGDVSDSERKKVRKALEKYCEMDTLAEVLIVNELRRIVGEEKSE